MFTVHCPTHGADVLLGPRAIESLSNTQGGVTVRWRCHCGTTGATHLHRHPASTVRIAA